MDSDKTAADLSAIRGESENCMKLYKNVDICDLASILEKGILSLDKSGNDNWENEKRAKNPTDRVYLFQPIEGESNSYPKSYYDREKEYIPADEKALDRFAKTAEIIGGEGVYNFFVGTAEKGECFWLYNVMYIF